jgi:porphobilinogen deaminase
VSAERALTSALGASCNSAVGAHATQAGDGRLILTAWVGRPDGSEWISDHAYGSPGEVGAEVAGRLAAVGAAELLK